MANDRFMYKCPVCGKNFAIWVPEEWVYKKPKYKYGDNPSNAKIYFCSWHCLRETEKIIQKRKGGKR